MNSNLELIKNMPDYTEELKSGALVVCPYVVGGVLKECSFKVNDGESLDLSLKQMKKAIINDRVKNNKDIKEEDLRKEEIPFIIINPKGFDLGKI